jgi:hypothetical protein
LLSLSIIAGKGKSSYLTSNPGGTLEMMAENNHSELFDEFRARMQNRLIAERKATIEQACKIMEHDEYLVEGVQFLAWIVNDDSQYLIVRDLAVEKLRPYQQLVDLGFKPGDEERILYSPCPEGHPNYYDKRKICGSKPIYLGQGDRIQLECKWKNCEHKDFTVEVNCEGFK